MKHTEETKLKQSRARKKYLLENPDKHPWKKHSKFKSVPCEKLKEYLNRQNILFIEEYSPLIDRAFAIDIAFPEKQIALEINGNQHYERDGSLKPYYQNRTKLLEQNGWRVYNIHYSCCFKEELITPIIQQIIQSATKLTFDYINYKPKIREIQHCVKCNMPIHRSTIGENCRKCRPRKRNIIWPDKDVLQFKILSTPIVNIAKEYNVSDSAVIKWCKFYSISRPGRGCWEKIYHTQ